MFKTRNARSLVLMFFLATIFPVAGQTHDDKDKKQGKEAVPVGTAVLWREPTDIASRDLFLGPGGAAMKPDLSHITFVKEEKTGHSTKYVVKDARGME